MTLPATLGTALLVASFAGLFALSRDIRKEAETQIRLDRCVAVASLELQGLMDLLEQANTRIDAVRAAIAAALVAVNPEAIPPLKIALRAQVFLQDAQQVLWKVRQAGWIATQGCGESGDLAEPLPDPSMERGPPDALGEQPLTWKAGGPPDLSVQVTHKHRAASAQLRRKNETATLSKNKWTSAWTPPRRTNSR